MHKIISYIKLVFLFFIFLFLFVSSKYVQYPLVCLIILSLFTLKRSKIEFPICKSAVFILLFFLINLISLIYSKDVLTGWNTIETQLSLLAIPLLFIFDKGFYEKNKKKILNLFVFASFIGILVFVILFLDSGNFIKLIHNAESVNAFVLIRWYDLSNSQHPTYVSLAFLFSTILLIHSISRKEKYYWIILKSLGILVLVIFIYLLNSRAILLSVFFIITYFLFKILRVYRRIFTYILVSLLFSGFGYIIINSRFQNNFEQIKNGETINKIESLDIRLSLWKDALLVWKEKPVLGYGIGDSKAKLIEMHQQRNIEEAFTKKYNCHNQFLETAIQTGFFGLIALLLVFAVPLYQAIKKKQELLFLFLSICFINFMFESMLQRIVGVVFFIFWYSFLWFGYYKYKKTETLT